MNKNKKKILLIEDDLDTTKIIIDFLSANNYEVLQAVDGREGIDIFHNDAQISCILCSLDTPNISGALFAQIIRHEGNKTPLIFITDNADFSFQDAANLGAQGILCKPIDNEELLKKLTEVETFSKMVNRSGSEVKLDDFYCKINIDEFVSGKKIVFPVYLKVSSSKFLKLAHTGEDLEPQKIELLKKNGVKYFYLENGDFKNYMKRNINIAKSLLQFKGIKDPQKRTFFLKITKNLMEYEFTREINSETLAMSVFTIHNTLRLVSNKKSFMKALEDLNSFSPSIVEHSMLVSLLGSAIALESKSFDNKTVSLVSLVGLYHDLGLKELPERLSSHDTQALPEDQTLYEGHSQIGSQLLVSIRGIPETVYQAVLHHHELCDGSGYPFGIGRVKINPVARIIALADHIAMTWSRECKNKDLKTVITELKQKTEIYDKDFVKAAISLVSSNEPVMKVLF
ncbi:MAG: response regulator [Bacteriovorax sp.]|jgi:response regulator RpfG family c-di-GMP phosphodiesterase